MKSFVFLYLDISTLAEKILKVFERKFPCKCPSKLKFILQKVFKVRLYYIISEEKYILKLYKISII